MRTWLAILQGNAVCPYNKSGTIILWFDQRWNCGIWTAKLSAVFHKMSYWWTRPDSEDLVVLILNYSFKGVYFNLNGNLTARKYYYHLVAKYSKKYNVYHNAFYYENVYCSICILPFHKPHKLHWNVYNGLVV